MSAKIEQQILNEAKGLPENALSEILHFIQLLKQKFNGKKGDIFKNNIESELSDLEKKEWQHLEAEVKNYKELYPHVK